MILSYPESVEHTLDRSIKNRKARVISSAYMTLKGRRAIYQDA